MGVENRSIVLYIIALALFVVHPEANAGAGAVPDTFDFRHFTTRDGLPHNYINSISQDSDGFIWIATRNGICRYDGYSFEIFKTILSDHSTENLLSLFVAESDNNEIWCVGGSVLSKFDGRAFRIYGESYAYAYPDRKGDIWFVKDQVLTRVEMASIDVLDDRSASKEDKLRLIFKDRAQKRWVFQNYSQQQIINSSKGFYYSYKIPNPAAEIHMMNDLYIDSENIIWIPTTNNGLIWFNPEKEKFGEYKYDRDDPSGLASNCVHEVYELDRSHLLIGTFEGMNILNRDDGSMKLVRNDLSNPRSLSDNIVRCFLKDRAGNLFVGTRYGLDLLHNKKFRHVSLREDEMSILSNNVHGFVEDGDKTTWVITSLGLSMLDSASNVLANYKVDHDKVNSLKGAPISIVDDRKKNLWIGTWHGGLSYFNKGSGIFKTYMDDYSDENSISDNRIMSLFRDSKDRIWVGTWGRGANLYNQDRDNFTVYPSDRNSEQGLTDRDVSSFAEDKFGRIWIGTLDGLNLLEDENNKIFRHFWRNEDDSTSLSHNQVTSLFSSGDYLWVGTNMGLNRINVVNFENERFMTEDGLPSNQIKAIEEDGEGCLWISTNKGLAKIIFKPGDRYEIDRIFSFTLLDGLQDNEFLERSAYRKSNGEMLFGGTNGFNTFHPEDIDIDSVAPVCVFTKFFVDDREIFPGDTVHGTVALRDRLCKTGKIDLSYKQNSFAIEFAGLYFSKPGEISYRYMLEGFDEVWKYADPERRVASYTNINKGKYTLLVDACNSNGYWGKEPISMEIEVIPPFWRTNWFRVLFYLAMVMLVLLIIDVRTRIIKKQKIKLERTIQERTSEIRMQKNSIEQQKEEIKSQADQIRRMNKLLQKHNIELKDNIESLSKARVMQKLLDYKEFNKIFKSENDCRQYLIDLKWGNGYHCTRCHGTEFSLENNLSRRCKKCNYKESTTSGTIFHHLRFPLDKAFYILIVTSTGRKINISELSRTLDLRLKTTWNFHNKVKDEIKRLKAPIKSDKGWTSLIITSPTGKKDFFS